MAEKNDPELRLLIVGCTGAGKSATGNSILMPQVQDFYFEESDGPYPFTISPTTASDDPLKNGQKVIVTDTPDISESWLNSYTTEGNSFMTQVSPGPHAILVIISSKERITKEIEKKLQFVRKIFGDEGTRHMIIVFTKIDILRKTRYVPQEFSECLERFKHTYVNSLLQESNNRYIGFNNNILGTGSEEEKQASKKQVEDLMMIIKEMMSQNSGSFWPIENLVKNDGIFLVRKMKKYAKEASRPTVFISSFATGIGLYHVLACLEDSLDSVAPIGCLASLIAWKIYQQREEHTPMKISHLNENPRYFGTTMIVGLSSGFLSAVLYRNFGKRM